MLPNFSWAASILILGDSLSANYGIAKEQGWVYLLQESMPQHNIINASVSGETSAGGLRRLPSLLKSTEPELVVIELGGNDGLRGFSTKSLYQNIKKIIKLTKEQGAKVLLIEIMVPPNYGPRYSQQFTQTYQQLAKEFNLTLVPFFMTQIATDPDLMQSDGIHPNAQAQPKIHSLMQPWINAAIISD